MATQKKHSFDKVTLVKIGKGALIAAGGAAALFILNAIEAMEFSNPLLASFVVWGVPTCINLVKEWMKGGE